ncbi:hypothetical protein BDF19DRAFT_424647 [Syncephalis fuscata]|nr:hypothetical protein BDF19DRAFT_424647 [Syncephalis fuscata]
MASATSHQLLEEVNTLPSMPAKASVQVEPSNESHKPQRKVSVGPLLRSSKARIMQALEQRSPRTSLAATLNFSPRNSMSFGLQSSMERNCSGATAVSITPSTDQELLETGLANFFKPVFELNQTRIDADERRRRQLHASALFDKLAASVNDCPTEDDRCFSSKVEPATLRLTLTPSLVRGDESVWSDELRYSSMEDDEISLMTKAASNGSFNRVPLKAALSKGSLRVSWIPEEPSEENQEAVQPIEHGTLTKLTEHSTSNFEIV